MQIQVLKSKLHCVTVTDANLKYLGSITIDEDLMDAANMIAGEKVQIVDNNNGERFETYIIKGERGSGCICLNGAAARKVQIGDTIIIISYALMDFEEAKSFKPTIVFPKEGSNLYVDAMCIPTCAQNKELAEIFINYMLSEEPAIANAEYTYYASPNSIVYTNEGYIEDMGEDTMAVLYPELGDFAAEYNRLAYRNLDADLLSNLNTLWENIKIN